ncbi:type II secretion system protein GspK [Maricaulis sp.]|uniref:general secretion pathway protein GspK n=1 Tax=Maricaulis sp. TaxID=1486257 RepID=UPI0025B961BF|nr:type II secretion system protein GspK [Maricaulis sp.]
MPATLPIRSERGAALVVVLWLSVLLAMVLLGVASLVQVRLQTARAERETLLRSQVMLSALDIAAFDIALVGRTALSDFPRRIVVGDRAVQVSLLSGAGRVDLNMANDEDLRALFARMGATPADARRLSDRVLDWRDADAETRPAGLEAADYPADWPRPAANRPFLTVGELRYVAGISDALVDCLAPYVTVLGGTPQPEFTELADPSSAPLDGIRIAFLAETDRPNGSLDRMTGLALFGGVGNRPFGWVTLGDDRPTRSLCAAVAVSERGRG